jgi:hypothetical protein
MGVVRRFGRILAGLGIALGLGGCVTSSEGLRYADGSYYSTAGEGRGDYYVGRADNTVRYLGDPFLDDFLWPYGGPWYGGWYGARFDGYCSVRYRYCPGMGWGWSDPFPRHGFDLYFGDPWRDGHRGRERWDDARPYERWRPPPRLRAAPGPRAGAGQPSDGSRENGPATRQPAQRPPRRVRDPMSNDAEAPAPRYRRPPLPRGNRPSSPPSEDQDGN